MEICHQKDPHMFYASRVFIYSHFIVCSIDILSIEYAVEIQAHSKEHHQRQGHPGPVPRQSAAPAARGQSYEQAQDLSDEQKACKVNIETKPQISCGGKLRFQLVIGQIRPGNRKEGKQNIHYIEGYPFDSAGVVLEATPQPEVGLDSSIDIDHRVCCEQ